MPDHPSPPFHSSDASTPSRAPGELPTPAARRPPIHHPRQAQIFAPTGRSARRRGLSVGGSPPPPPATERPTSNSTPGSPARSSMTRPWPPTSPSSTTRGALPGQTRRPGGPGRRADRPGARRRPRSRPGSPIQCRGPGGRARHVPPPASRTGQKHLRDSLLTGHRAARSSTSSAHWFRLLPDSSAASAAWRCTSGLTRNIIRPE